MSIRLTQKAFKRINHKPEIIEKNIESNFLHEWFVNTFIAGRRHYFIITEARSLYSSTPPLL